MVVGKYPFVPGIAEGQIKSFYFLNVHFEIK